MSGLGPSDSTASSTMNRGPALLAVAVITTVTALSTCVLRYCVKKRINRSHVSWDDYFIGASMLLGIIGMSLAIVEGVNQSRPQTALQYDYLVQPWLNMSSALSKVSICLLFRRMVPAVGMGRNVLHIQIRLLLAVNLVYSLTTLLQCRPLEKLWRPDVDGSCWSITVQHNIDYFEGAYDIFSDLFIALFPIMIIRNLGIERNMRLPFYSLSVISVSVAILAIVRTYNISLIRATDEYTFQIISTILAVLEQNLGITSANILPISSLFSKNIRPISQALSEAAGAHNDNNMGHNNNNNNNNNEFSDTASILSKTSKKSSSKRHSNGSAILIEGPQRESYEGTTAHHHHYASSREQQAAADGGADAWPMGIIKTVSVEVVNEEVVDVERGGGGMDIADGKRVSGGGDDWARYFR